MTPDAKRQQREIKKQGYDPNKPIPKVGFFVKDMSASQITYLLTKRLNEWYQDNFHINFVVFVENLHPPAIETNFPIYQLKDIMGFDGTVISTSFLLWLKAQKSSVAKHYWMVYDLEWTQPEQHPDMKNLVMTALKDPNVNKMFRHKNHYDIVKALGGNSINEQTVDDFDLSTILKITGVSSNG